jgi:hypothetical protein
LMRFIRAFLIASGIMLGPPASAGIASWSQPTPPGKGTMTAIHGGALTWLRDVFDETMAKSAG